MLLAAFLTLISAIFIYFLIDYLLHLTTLHKYLPGPFPLPIVGSLHLVGEKPHEVFAKLGKV